MSEDATASQSGWLEEEEEEDGATCVVGVGLIEVIIPLYCPPVFLSPCVFAW